MQPTYNLTAELNRSRLLILLDAFERCSEESGRAILRHAMQHLVDPTWERQWPTAIPERSVR